MTENKKILIVAYHFSPDAEVGALRPQKFAKYLPEFGWQPYVLTVKEKYIEKRDEGRLQDVLGIPITRTSFWRTPLKLFLDIRDKFRNKKLQHFTENRQPPTSVNGKYNKKELLSARLKRYFVLFNWFPDEKLYWTIPAVIAGNRLIHKEKIKYIFATSPPHTVAIIGLILSKLTGAKLVIDFRDPWVSCRQRMPETLRCRFYDELETKCEEKVIQRAHLVISTTDRLCKALRAYYPAIPSEKFATITNGYDKDDFKRINVRADNKDKYIISYIGTFYLERNPEIFLKALRKVITEGNIPTDKLEVRFIGVVNEVINKPISLMLEEQSMTDFVTVKGQVPHSEALRQMHEADLLLLFAPNFSYQIPAKTFEYIAARRPILVLAEDGATADLIREVNAGLVVNQEDFEEIYQALKQFYHHYLNSSDNWYKGSSLKEYDRKALTRRLVDLLER